MVIIAFSEKTSKFIPKFVCRKFKHCAPIIPNGRTMTMFQFTAPGQITKIEITMQGIRKLGACGWRFVYVPCDAPAVFDTSGAISCVNLSKRALRIKAPLIQTPDGLYKYLHE